MHAFWQRVAVVSESELVAALGRSAADEDVACVQVDALDIGVCHRSCDGESGGFGRDAVAAGCAGVVLGQQGNAGWGAGGCRIDLQVRQVAAQGAERADVAGSVLKPGKNAPAAGGANVGAVEVLGRRDVHPAAFQVGGGETLVANLVGGVAGCVVGQQHRVAQHCVGGQRDTEGGFLLRNHVVVVVQAGVLARSQSHRQRLRCFGVDAHIHRLAGGADVARDVGLDDAQDMVTFAQCGGWNQIKPTRWVHCSCVTGIARVAPGVDGDFFAVVKSAVAVAIIKQAQPGSRVAVALNPGRRIVGDVVALDAAVIAVEQLDFARRGNGGVDGDGQTTRQGAAVASSVHSHRGDDIAAVAQWCGRWTVGKEPGIVGGHAGAAKQVAIGIHLDLHDVLVGGNRASKAETVAAAQDVVAATAHAQRAGLVVARAKVGR